MKCPGYLSTVSVAAWLAWPGLAFAQNNVVFHTCPRLASPPVLDGMSDDPCWKNVAPIPKMFAFRTTQPFVLPAEIETTTRAGFDDKALYFSIFCHEKDASRIRADCTKRDDPSYWKDDCVELYLSRDHSVKGCRKFAATSTGVQMDMLGEFDMAWSAPHWKVAASKTKTGWGIEVSLPWEDLGGPASDGDIWSFALVRFSWAHSTNGMVGAVSSPGMSHNNIKAGMGYLIFGERIEQTLRKLTTAISARQGSSWRLNSERGAFEYRDYADELAGRMKNLSQTLDECRSALWRLPKRDLETEVKAAADKFSQIKAKLPSGGLDTATWLELDEATGELASQLEELKMKLAIQRLLQEKEAR